MLMRGRCGFWRKEERRSAGGMRAVTPGKWVSKNWAILRGEDWDASRVEKTEAGAKRVHVNEPS